jgi:uncharacterized damage-inducible protein DinB
VRRTVDLSDAEMGREWKWGAYDEEGLRFALLITHHELRDLAVRLAAARERQPTQTERILAHYHQAYREMTASLAAARSEDLDRAPAEGEWPLREVCVHMLGAEYGFLRVCRIALERHRAGKAGEPPMEEWDAASVPYIQAREAATQSLGSGTIEQIRDAFATVHIRNLRELGDITDRELELLSWFWDGPMPIRFRLHRFEGHLRQHTIQLEGTLAGIGRPPTEAHHLVRDISNALAEVESELALAEHLRSAAAKTIADRIPTISAALA